VITQGRSGAIDESRWLLVYAFSMALYEYRASYTAKPMAAQFKRPQDPGSDQADTRGPGSQARGGWLFSNEFDVLVVYEAPNDMTTASAMVAVATMAEVKVGQDHATAQRPGMARVFAQAQDYQHPEARPAATIGANCRTSYSGRRSRGCN
jgi:hypothetical protein